VAPRGTAEPDLTSSLENRDDHDVGHPDGTHQESDGAKTKEQVVERPLGVDLSDQSH
jgi:hypothetical protein